MSVDVTKERGDNLEGKQLRVLYSFPHKLGDGRICYIAWEQVNGLAAAGAKVLAFPGVLHREVASDITVRPTLARGRLRISYKLAGTMRACAIHDYIVARRLEKLAGQIDIVHAWPLGARRTLRTAARLGIPTVIERPNTHTAFAYEVVQRECERLGVALPSGVEHSFNEHVLKHEEEEYDAAYRILCPSEFVMKTFVDRGFSKEKLVRHTYGFDEKQFFPRSIPRDPRKAFTMLFAGFNAVRKGVHFALEAWLKSPACETGQFLIAGEFMLAYAEKLKDMLSHPSVKVLGHRSDVPELMRQSDVFVLPSIEEGFGLVCVEAMGSGCVPIVSTTCTDVCRHMENALVHDVGDTDTLSRHISMLHADPQLLNRLRDGCLATAPNVTWSAAGARLLTVYKEVLADAARFGVPANK
jgi:glycosyltransferase involved in cell wall biosynthesis